MLKSVVDALEELQNCHTVIKFWQAENSALTRGCRLSGDESNGLVPLLKDDETDLLLWNPMPLSAIWRRNTGRTGYGLIIRRGVRGEKWMNGRIKR